MYRALKYSQTNPGDWVVLPGAGGGLGHLGERAMYATQAQLYLTALRTLSAIQYAKVRGLRVVAVGTSP